MVRNLQSRPSRSECGPRQNRLHRHPCPPEAGALCDDSADAAIAARSGNRKNCVAREANRVGQDSPEAFSLSFGKAARKAARPDREITSLAILAATSAIA